jgi:RNA-directed DNA polymerase
VSWPSSASLGDDVRRTARRSRDRHQLDLADFFSCIREARVRRIFAALGYPDRVAACLASLCVTNTPEWILAACPVVRPSSERERTERVLQRQRLRSTHLPQGAPTSSALANLAAYRLDVRLSALARSLGGAYTRYADDLALSGGVKMRAALPAILPRIGAIALEEGFELRYGKTRVMTSAVRQRLCGVVVNRAPSIARRDYERLEATLFNCARHGPWSQNREGHPDFEAHLRGRVAWVTQLHPEKGARLGRLLAAVNFSSADG